RRRALVARRSGQGGTRRGSGKESRRASTAGPLRGSVGFVHQPVAKVRRKDSFLTAGNAVPRRRETSVEWTAGGVNHAYAGIDSRSSHWTSQAVARAGEAGRSCGSA